MKTYNKPTLEVIELRESVSVMLNTSNTQKANSSETVLSNRRRNVWSSGWDE